MTYEVRSESEVVCSDRALESSISFKVFKTLKEMLLNGQIKQQRRGLESKTLHKNRLNVFRIVKQIQLQDLLKAFHKI